MVRQCPECGEDIVYKYDGSFYRARKENRICNRCRYELYPPTHNKGNHLSEETKEKISRSKRGKVTWNKGIPMSSDTKGKISISCLGRIPWSKGKTFSIDYVRKLQMSHIGQPSPMKGKYHSDETRHKIRMAILSGLRTRGISHRSNPTACKFIDDLNEVQGWNLQHAGNGGEVEVYGYLLDGYDERRGIIFEYDEPQHHLVAKKQKDIRRQRDLFSYFASINRSISFWRYDERYKTLYEVLP